MSVQGQSRVFTRAAATRKGPAEAGGLCRAATDSAAAPAPSCPVSWLESDSTARLPSRAAASASAAAALEVASRTGRGACVGRFARAWAQGRTRQPGLRVRRSPSGRWVRLGPCQGGSGPWRRQPRVGEGDGGTGGHCRTGGVLESGERPGRRLSSRDPVGLGGTRAGGEGTCPRDGFPTSPCKCL